MQESLKSKVFNPRNRQNLIAVIVVGLMVLAGIIFLVISRAAISSVGIESESGTLTGGATVVNDAQASGGKYVQFGTVSPGGDTTPPIVSLTAPAAGTSVGVNTPVNLAATASDNIAVTRVEFYVGATLLTTDTNAPYTASWGGSATAGTFNLTAKAYDAAGNTKTSAAVGVTVTGGGGGTVTIAAAGDIAGQAPNQDGATAKLINSRIGSLSAVIPLGDIQYPSGGNYTGFNSTWGVFKSKMKPTPGNHDYLTSSGAGYYSYFGGIAKYYSYNIGSWHIISLNSQEPANSGSAQETWLKNDLAGNTAKCTLAYMHYPRFSSPGSTKHGDQTQLQTLWQDLYNANADVVLGGHDHDFEQFAPSTPTGATDTARGIVEFVVGTGGASLDPVTTGGSSAAKSLGGTSTAGVLFMDLGATDYSWHFDGVNGTPIKSGTGVCH